jgi:peroxiredoxin
LARREADVPAFFRPEGSGTDLAARATWRSITADANPSIAGTAKENRSMRPEITVGATLADYELPDHTDKLRKLSVLQGDDPLILTLNRGFYCPKDRIQLLELTHFSKQCAVAYTRLVTITTDNLLQSGGLRLGVGADWTFLHDTERIIQKDLDIAEYTDPHNDPMIPHTFVLEPRLKIYKIYNGYWYWGRPSGAELQQDVREVTRRIRPDWKIDTPEMREKWDRGDRSAFFPYGKPLKQVIARMANAVDQFE